MCFKISDPIFDDDDWKTLSCCPLLIQIPGQIRPSHLESSDHWMKQFENQILGGKRELCCLQQRFPTAGMKMQKKLARDIIEKDSLVDFQNISHQYILSLKCFITRYEH